MSAPGEDDVEVVVLLDSPPLAQARGAGEEIAASSARSGASSTQQVPAADVGWRYRLVANGFSVSLPQEDLPRLRALSGVREVLPREATGRATRLDAAPDRCAGALGPRASTPPARG